MILSGNTSPSPVFTAPSVSADSTLTFQLIVTDTHGAQSTPDTVNVEVKFVNHPPVAVAKSDPSSAEVSTEVTLDGSQSYDPDPDDSIAEYQWQQVDNTGVKVTLSDPNSPTPTFIAPDLCQHNMEEVMKLFQLFSHYNFR